MENLQTKPTYNNCVIRNIDEKTVNKFSEKLNLGLTNEESVEYMNVINGQFPTFSSLYKLEEKRMVSEFPRALINMEENPYNAFTVKCKLEGNKEGILANKKIAVKDTVLIAGLPLTDGSQLLEGYVADEDASIVIRVLKHGGNIVGKSRCEDLCYSANSFTCFNGIVLNPLDNARTSGGSSSGSAALVAGGIVDIAIAGDQGGSIRIPAASCKVIGFKPTFGLIPYTGVLGVEYTFDHVGPIANKTEDIALFMDATAGTDGFDQRYFTYLKYSNFSIDNKDNEKNKTQ